MANVVLGQRRRWEYTGNDVNGDPCIFPRDTRNHVFLDASGFSRCTIDRKTDRYIAFPVMLRINRALLVIYSNSQAHAVGTRQFVAISFDDGRTWDTSLFEIDGVVDPSPLNDLLTNGDTVILKAWTVQKKSGQLYVFVNSYASGPDGAQYALWSRAKKIGGIWYRTGYSSAGAAALFKSTDDGVSWTYVSQMFIGAGLIYSEADFIVLASGQWLAMCREDMGVGNPIYQATSNDAGLTWSAPVLVTAQAIGGRQPCLERMSDGSIVLGLGDRSGTSGYDASGVYEFGFDTTGICIWRSTDNAASWSWPLRIDGMYSTDGGQPMLAEVTDGRIAVSYYARRNADDPPVLAYAALRPDVL